MARVPRYQQNQLESSMVGTAGVDTSVASAFARASQTFDGLENVVYHVMEEDYRAQQIAVARAQAEKQAAQKEMQTLMYSSNAAASKAVAGAVLNEMSNKLRTQYAHKTDGAMEDFNTQGSDLISQTLDAIQDPKQRLMTGKLLMEEFSTQQKQFSDWVFSQQHPIAVENAKRVGDALRVAVNDPTLGVDAVLAKLQKFSEDKDNMQVFYTAYGAASEVEMRKYKSDAARNYMSQVANTGTLEEVKALIRDKRFDSIVEGSDKEQFYSRQRQIATQEEQQRQHQTTIKNRTTDIDAIIELTNSSPDGTIEHAPAALVEKWRKDPNTSPQMKTRLAPVQAKARIYETTVNNDRATISRFAAQVNQFNQLQDAVLKRYADLYDTKNNRFKHHGKSLDNQIKLLQRDMEHCITVYEDVKSIAASVQTPEAKKAITSYSLKLDRELGFVRSYINRDPRAIQMKAAKDAFDTSVGAPDVKYLDSQQQKVYNYYYRLKMAEYWDFITSQGRTSVSKGYATRLRTEAQKFAAEQVERRGFR